MKVFRLLSMFVLVMLLTSLASSTLFLAEVEACPMQSIIDIIIVFDAKNILNLDYIEVPGTAEDPALITDPDHLIYMISHKDDAIEDSLGGDELEINAKVNDIIRWRGTTISSGTDYSVILYEYESDQTDLLEPPNPILSKPIVPLAKLEDLENPDTQEINDFFWETTTLKEGEETYHFKFIIFDKDEQKLGYYQWDPSINIVP